MRNYDTGTWPYRVPQFIPTKRHESKKKTFKRGSKDK